MANIKRITERNLRIKKDWKYALTCYRRLAAALIEETRGYFTPRSAVASILMRKFYDCYWGCELYDAYDLEKYSKEAMEDSKTLIKEHELHMYKRNNAVIRSAIRNRRFSRKSARSVVEENLAGNESIGASWF